MPCSRSDVFASQNVNVIEKRMLMKLLTFCLEFDKHPSDDAGSFDVLAAVVCLLLHFFQFVDVLFSVVFSAQCFKGNPNVDLCSASS